MAEVTQHLVIKDMQITATQEVDDPPQFELELEVQHAESGQRWWQGVTFPKGALVQLSSLLDYTLKKENLR